MWRAAASQLRRIPPGADWTSSAQQLQACLGAYSRLPVMQQTRGLAAALAAGRSAVLALRHQSMRSVPHSAHQPTAAGFSAVAVASSWASAARYLCQQSPGRQSAALQRLALLAMPRSVALVPSSGAPSASHLAAMRCYSSKITAAMKTYATRGPARAGAAAAAAGGARITQVVLGPAARVRSRQLMSAAKAGVKGAPGAAMGPPAAAAKRAVLHPTAILAARSSRHFSSLTGPAGRGYESSGVRVMLRRSMDPKVVLYGLMGGHLS